MSTSEVQSRAAPNGRSPSPPDEGHGLPGASLADGLRFVAAGLLPSLARGLFSPRRRMMKLIGALDTDRRARDVLASIRAKNGGQGARLLGGRMAVVWGPDAIREVLDRSADVYDSGAGAKGKGMSHFQPDALTLSKGDDWRDRRAFNESVLATSERVHPFGERFAAVAEDEVERLHIVGDLDWPRWERLFDHLTLRVIFGDRARGDRELTDRLERLMAEANRIVGLSEGDEFHEFQGELERHLRDPEPGSLVARFADAPQTDRTRVAQQVPHWIFAMRDTLGANCFRALAAIVADRDVERRVREEVDAADLADPAAIAGMSYLEGCLQETMRLWPTTPLLARETTRNTVLNGTELGEGTQVMIVNSFNHRDTERVPDADGFDPGRWAGGGRDPRFNHLSGGAQSCPGGPMVSLLGKAVLARMLDAYELELRQPDLSLRPPLPHMLDFFEIRFDAAVRR